MNQLGRRESGASPKHGVRVQREYSTVQYSTVQYREYSTESAESTVQYRECREYSTAESIGYSE
jgi:hypothetical protein